jgi:hypothetical protein
LELQPFGDVVLQLLYFALYERKRALQCVIREARELKNNNQFLPGSTAGIKLLTNEVYNTSDAVLPCI